MARQIEFSSISDSFFNPMFSEPIKINKHFTEKDFVSGEDGGGLFVKHSALLRVFKSIFRVISYTPELLQVPVKSNEWCSSVKATYKFLATHSQEVISWSAIADCNTGNSSEGFERYTTTMAETRASARALRNILGVEFCSKEELASNKTDDLPIQNNQKVLIETKFMGELGVTIEDINNIMSLQGVKVSSVDELNRNQAAIVIDKLNSKSKKKEKINVAANNK